MSASRSVRTFVLALSMACAAAPLAAVRADEDADEQEEPESDFDALESRVGECFAAKRYAEAAEACRAQMALAPKNPNPPYNLACALARQGKKDEALAALAKAVELGFDDADHMKADEDLASLRAEAAFAELAVQAGRGSYDPGGEVAGAKSLDRAPEGGLRCRLLVPETATEDRPVRLLVWLHPSGGSMNAKVVQHAASWMKSGWAVLLPTQKGWAGWKDADAARLVEKSIPDADTVAGVDARRPVLVGFSAGGQMALSLWAKDASRFGGLMLDAAYPIDLPAYQRGEMKMIDPPEGDAAKTAPVYVLVGDADQGNMAWKGVEPGWKARGVPLTVRYVPKGRHEWLLRDDAAAEFDTWLADVAAGRLPGAPAPAAPAPAPEPAK